MLSHEFKESQEGRINLPDKSYAERVELLQFMYPNFIREFDGGSPSDP